MAIDMQPIMNGHNAVKIAINKVKINYLKQSIPNKIVTSVDEPLHTVLSVHVGRVSSALKEVDEYLNDIDKYCNYRFGWEKQREQIHSNYVNVFEAWNFDKEFNE